MSALILLVSAAWAGCDVPVAAAAFEQELNRVESLFRGGDRPDATETLARVECVDSEINAVVAATFHRVRALHLRHQKRDSEARLEMRAAIRLEGAAHLEELATDMVLRGQLEEARSVGPEPMRAAPEAPPGWSPIIDGRTGTGFPAELDVVFQWVSDDRSVVTTSLLGPGRPFPAVPRPEPELPAAIEAPASTELPPAAPEPIPVPVGAGLPSEIGSAERPRRHRTPLRWVLLGTGAAAAAGSLVEILSVRRAIRDHYLEVGAAVWDDWAGTTLSPHLTVGNVLAGVAAVSLGGAVLLSVTPRGVAVRGRL